MKVPARKEIPSLRNSAHPSWHTWLVALDLRGVLMESGFQIRPSALPFIYVDPCHSHTFFIFCPVLKSLSDFAPALIFLIPKSIISFEDIMFLESTSHDFFSLWRTNTASTSDALRRYQDVVELLRI